jgi:hypothetical protein
MLKSTRLGGQGQVSFEVASPLGIAANLRKGILKISEVL